VIGRPTTREIAHRREWLRREVAVRAWSSSLAATAFSFGAHAGSDIRKSPAAGFADCAGFFDGGYYNRRLRISWQAARALARGLARYRLGRLRASLF